MAARDAVLFARENAAQVRLSTPRVERVRTGDQRHRSSLATAIAGIDVERRHAARGQQVDKDVGALPEGLEHRVLRSTDEDESIGIPHRQRLQENRVEQAEDGRGDADRERQREDDGGGEARRRGPGRARRSGRRARRSRRRIPSRRRARDPLTAAALPSCRRAARIASSRDRPALEVLIEGGFDVGTEAPRRAPRRADRAARARRSRRSSAAPSA